MEFATRFSCTGFCMAGSCVWVEPKLCRGVAAFKMQMCTLLSEQRGRRGPDGQLATPRSAEAWASWWRRRHHGHLLLQFRLLTAGGKRASSLPAPAFPFGLAPGGRSLSPANREASGVTAVPRRLVVIRHQAKPREGWRRLQEKGQVREPARVPSWIYFCFQAGHLGKEKGKGSG